jgi:hypothetical protein
VDVLTGAADVDDGVVLVDAEELVVEGVIDALVSLLVMRVVGTAMEEDEEEGVVDATNEEDVMEMLIIGLLEEDGEVV